MHSIDFGNYIMEITICYLTSAGPKYMNWPNVHKSSAKTKLYWSNEASVISHSRVICVRLINRHNMHHSIYGKYPLPNVLLLNRNDTNLSQPPADSTDHRYGNRCAKSYQLKRKKKHSDNSRLAGYYRWSADMWSG